MVDKIKKIIQDNFPEYTIESTMDEDKKQATISAEKGWSKGFDVDILLSEEKISISFSSKIRMIAMIAGIGVTILLLYLFGGSILNAMGLVSNTGRTLRILYTIPGFIFLIPSIILANILSGMINPPDKALVESVRLLLESKGIDAEIA